MKSKIYGKVRSYLDNGLYVLLVSAFRGESGKIDGDMRKIMHAKSNGCEYNEPVKFIGEDLITTYEPMAPFDAQEDRVMTGLDRNIIANLCEEPDEIVTITIIDALAKMHQGSKLYMRRDGTIHGVPEGAPLPKPVIDRIASEAEQLFGTGEYRFLIIPMDEAGEAGYSILLEDIE